MLSEERRKTEEKLAEAVQKERDKSQQEIDRVIEEERKKAQQLLEEEQVGVVVFLAHLSHRLRVSYSHWPMSVVLRPSCVVRRPSCVVNNCFKQHLL